MISLKMLLEHCNGCHNIDVCLAYLYKLNKLFKLHIHANICLKLHEKLEYNVFNFRTSHVRNKRRRGVQEKIKSILIKKIRKCRFKTSNLIQEKLLLPSLLNHIINLWLIFLHIIKNYTEKVVFYPLINHFIPYKLIWKFFYMV